MAKPLNAGQMALTVRIRSDVLPNSTSTDARSRESDCLAPLCTRVRKDGWGHSLTEVSRQVPAKEKAP